MKQNIIFLDVDGVLNCELHYRSLQFTSYKQGKKQLKKQVKKQEIELLEYYKSQISLERIQWLNELCKETNSVVVISSSWRHGKTVEELREILEFCGSEFTIIDKTPYLWFANFPEGKSNCSVPRGAEIKYYLDYMLPDNLKDYNDYVIIDDDGDMLYWQRNNFFQTDTYSGLTPNICYRIKRFLNRER